MGNEASVSSDIQHAFTPADIKRLYKKFSKLDTDKSGELEPEEFFDIPA